MKLVRVCLCAVMLCSIASAATIHVPVEQPTIQAGMSGPLTSQRPDSSSGIGQATGFFTELAPMPGPRYSFHAVTKDNMIYCLLGLPAPPTYGSDNLEYRVYRYSVSDDVWTVEDTMVVGSFGAYATSIGNRFLFAGGEKMAGWIKDSVFSYDLLTGEIDTLQNLRVNFKRCVNGKKVA